MMTMRQTVFAIAAAALIAPAASAQQTHRLTAEKHNEYGIVYTLPNTALAVTVKARKTVAEPGPFHQYAKQCLGKADVVNAPSISWEITDVEITPYGVPDAESQYLMQLKPGAVAYLNVADNDMLLSINTDDTDYDEPQASRAVVATVGDADYDPNAYLKFVGEDFLASQSSVQQARMLAEGILEVRDAKIELTRGTADNMPTDGRQLELMLNSLSEQEEAMTKAFTGNTYSQEMEATYTVLPTDEGRRVLLRLSDFDGFTDADDLAGAPMYFDLKVTRRGELPVDDKGVEKKLPKDAVIYNVPGRARVTLTWRGRTLLEQEVEMSQFGVQFGLNPLLFTDRKAPSYVIFNPATGGIRSIGPVSDLQQ